MYTRTIGAFEARRQFGKLITDVGYKGSSVIVEKNGEALAAIVPIERYKQWERERSQFFTDLRRFGAVDLSEDEAMALANQAIQEVRAEKRAKKLAEPQT